MKWKRILLKSFVFFSFFICILFTFIYFYISLSPKMDLKKTNNIIIYDKDDNVIYKGNGSKEWISLELIDKDNVMVISASCSAVGSKLMCVSTRNTCLPGSMSPFMAA